MNSYIIYEHCSVQLFELKKYKQEVHLFYSYNLHGVLPSRRNLLEMKDTVSNIYKFLSRLRAYLDCLSLDENKKGHILARSGNT